MIDGIKQNRLLVSLIVLVTIGVVVFNVFHYSKSYGIVEIDNVNSLLLVPFILLICWFGILLGTTKNADNIQAAYQNRLSAREKEVLQGIESGKKNKDIADELFVDISTIKSHINNIYKKTGLSNRKELRFYAEKVLKKVGVE